MQDPKYDDHETETNQPRYLSAEWFASIEKKAILNGFISLYDLAYLLATVEDCSRVLPQLWRTFKCDVRDTIKENNLAGQNVENFNARFLAWDRLLERWGGVAVGPNLAPAFWGKVDGINYLTLYRREPGSVKLQAVMNDRETSDLVKLSEFEEYIKNIEKSYEINVPLPIKLFPPCQAEASPLSQKPASGDYEIFIRSLRVSYENGEQIRVQKPGELNQPYNYVSFGFKGIGRTWEKFLGILESREHSFYVGPAHKVSGDIKKRINAYDSNHAFLRELNKKWINFVHKTFGREAPKKFKVYEKLNAEKPGTYNFKFQIVSPSEGKTEKEYGRFSDDKLLSMFEGLQKKKKPLVESDKETASETLAEIWKRKLMSKEEIEDIAKELTALYRDPETLKYDPYENDPDRNIKSKDRDY